MPDPAPHSAPQVAPSSAPDPAGFWVRFVAHLIDTTLLGAAATVLWLIGLGVFFWVRAYFPLELGRWGDFLGSGNPVVFQATAVGLHALLAIPYYSWTHYRYGTTAGKVGFHLYVVDRDGVSRISGLQSAIRCAAYSVSWFFIVGYLMAAFHPKKRALHDLIAGTRVIRRPFRRHEGIPE